MFEFDNAEFIKNISQSFLLNNNPELNSLFDSATTNAIAKIKLEIKENETLSKKLSEKSYSKTFAETHIPTTDDIEIMEDQADCDQHTGLLKDKLISIFEMRIVSLFKSVEIEIKQLLKQTYTDINTKNFYRWDIMSNFFKSIDININDIEGYSETNQLRIVNNQIKHNSTLNNDVKSIPEFSHSDNFSPDNLETFYSRIYPITNKFVSSLSREIYNERYEFNDERLLEIANSYKGRMDKSTLSKFIEKLNS